VSELKQLGRYEIKGVLGKGAMGLVYDGHDPQLNRRVAIKTIITKGLDESTAKHYEMRFRKEVRAVAKLSHPNIVQVYDFGSEGDLAYIVMEHIQGKELKDMLDNKEKIDLKTTFKLMLQLLDALHFAHEQGIVHRDIKPANMMIDVAGQAKLADFGVARVDDPDAGGEKTRVGAVIGTPSYMSPEQMQGQPIDRRADIWAAGVVFYQLLTGVKPFEGSNWALAKKVIMEDPVWPSQVLQLNPVMDRVVARALQKEPDKRYQTAKAFADALQRILRGEAPEDPNEAAGAAAPAAGGAAEVEFWDGVKDSDDPDDIALYLEQFPQGAFVAQARKRIAELGGGAAPAPAPAGAAVPPGSEAEKEFWEGVKDSDDPDDIALYLEQFPQGVFIAEAKKRIAELGGK
jgi:eukaryotic-like serine/threonine-protein kinase